MDLHLIPLPTHLRLVGDEENMDVDEFILEYGPPSPPRDRLDRAGLGRVEPESTDASSEGPQ